MSTIFMKLIENNESTITICYSFNNKSYENSISFNKKRLSSDSGYTTTLYQENNDNFSNHILNKVTSFIIDKIQNGGEIKSKEKLSIDDDPRMKDYFIENVLETVKKILPSHKIKSDAPYVDYTFEITKDNELSFILQFSIESTMCAMFYTTYDEKKFRLVFDTDYIYTHSSPRVDKDMIEKIEEANGDLYRITETIINYVTMN